MSRPSLLTRPSLAAMSLAAGVGLAASIAQADAPALLTDAAAIKSAVLDAYVYGYSLITTDLTRVQSSNVAAVDEQAMRAPLNQFANVKRYPPADFRGVSAPNADTLYSVAWIDLTEPQVFSHPDMGSRYHLFEMVDLWMYDLPNSPSSRTGDGKAANYLLTGPGWTGTVPEGMVHIPIDTTYMVILARTYADGTDADYAAVNALQAQYKITPLSVWGTEYAPVTPAVNENPPYSMTEKPQEAILSMNAQAYFQRMADLMCKHAPAAADDAPMLAKMASIGVEPCKTVSFSADVTKAIADLPKDALAEITKNQSELGKEANGWTITEGLGNYGTDYMKRAVVAAFGWPANRQEDAVYPYTFVDSTGAQLSGANSYALTFAKEQLPPARGFWSITMYEIDNGWWFVPNSLNKFTVSMRDKPVANADGSYTFTVSGGWPPPSACRADLRSAVS